MPLITIEVESDSMTISENGYAEEGARFYLFVPDGRYRMNGEDHSLSGE